MAQKNKVPAKSQVKKATIRKSTTGAAMTKSHAAAAAAAPTKTKDQAKTTVRQKQPTTKATAPHAKIARTQHAASASINSAAAATGEPVAALKAKQTGIAAKAKAKAQPMSKPATGSKDAGVKTATVPVAVARAGLATARAATANPVAAQAARTVPATAAKQATKSASAPAQVVVPRVASTPSMPRDIAARTAEARHQPSGIAVKKPVSQRHGFNTNEYIVYPAHGVGRIVGIEEQEIAGMSLELFVIQFEKDKMTLRVPTGKLQSVGMRKLAEDDVVTRAMTTLKGRARIKRTMWSRRAQEYEAKINSGDLVSIAEVVRDLYRSESQPEQSYSERQLYEAALDRMAREIAAVEQLDERGAVQRITEVLSKSARGRRLALEASELEASEEAAAEEAADVKAA